MHTPDPNLFQYNWFVPSSCVCGDIVIGSSKAFNLLSEQDLVCTKSEMIFGD